MVEDLVVVGAGGFGREVLDVAEAINRAAPKPVWRILGVADDAPIEINLLRLKERQIPYLGPASEVLRLSGIRLVLGIGNPRVRRSVQQRMAGSKTLPATLIHPTAVMGSQVKLRHGVVICAGVSVGTNVTVGEHVHLNPHAVIGHDTRLGDFLSVNPNATVSGECKVGDEVLIGAAAVVLQGLEVGRGATVAAGACVVRDVAPGLTVKGIPAR